MHVTNEGIYLTFTTLAPNGAVKIFRMQRINGAENCIKKRRRRRQKLQRLPVSAWITFSDQLKGDIGLLSRNLWSDVFENGDFLGQNEIRHIAVSSWFPNTPDFLHQGKWKVLPVKVDDGHGQHSQLQFCSSSPNSNSLRESLKDGVGIGSITHDARGIEIRMLDVEH